MVLLGYSRVVTTIKANWAMVRLKKAILPAIFLFSLSLNGILHYTFFIQARPVFNKYPAFALQYVHSSIDRERLVDFSPLYLWIHIAANTLFGHPKEIILWMQFILVAGSAVLVFLLLRSFFSSWIAGVGTVAFILNRSIAVYSGIFEPETFLIFFLLGFLVSLPQKKRSHAAVSGIFFSLVLLLRLNLFPVAFIVPLYFYLNGERKKLFFQRTIFFLLPVFCVLLLLAARNVSFSGTFSPVTMNPGTVLYDGNNPNANGLHVVYPPMAEAVAVEIPHEVDRGHIAYRLLARRAAGKHLSISEVNSYWAGKALHFIADHPFYWSRLALGKLYAAFHGARFHDIDLAESCDRLLQKHKIPSIPFSLISAMSLVGLVLSLRFWRKRLILYAVFSCQLCVMIVTYASDRQRISIIALFVFFAAAVIQELFDKTVSIPRKVVTLSIVLALCVFFSIKTDTFKEDVFLRFHVQQAHALLNEAQNNRRSGLMKEASAKNALAGALLPSMTALRLYGLWFSEGSLGKQALGVAESSDMVKADFSSRFDLAVLCMENGELSRSEAILKELIAGGHTLCRNTAQSSQPEFYLAKIYEKQGKKPEAIASLRAALKKNPGDPWALSHLSVLSGDTGYKNRISRYFDEIDAEYFMGLGYFENGRYDEALPCFEYVVGQCPEYFDGITYSSIALGAKGDIERAARQYVKSLRKNIEPLFAQDEILAIFRQWVKQNPQNTEANYSAGLVFNAFGQYDQALDLLQRLMKENPTLEAVKSEIDWAKQAKLFYGLK